MEVLNLLVTVLLIQLSKSAPQKEYTQPSFKWAFAQSYSWTYTPNTSQLPNEQQNAAVQVHQTQHRPDYFQNNPFYQTPNTNINQMISGLPIQREPSHNTRFSASESSYREPQITPSSPPISDQNNNAPILPVANTPHLNHATNYYSQTVAEQSDPTEAYIRAIVQRVIAEVTKDASIRQSTNNQELEQIIRRILKEQYQTSNVQKVAASSPTKLQTFPRSFPSNDVLNTFSNTASNDAQVPTGQCFQNGQCDSVAPAVANSMNMPLEIRQTANSMTYTSV